MVEDVVFPSFLARRQRESQAEGPLEVHVGALVNVPGGRGEAPDTPSRPFGSHQQKARVVSNP